MVLGQNQVFAIYHLLCLFFTIRYRHIKAHKSIQKVLVWAVNSAQECSEMAGKPDDGHSHRFQP